MSATDVTTPDVSDPPLDEQTLRDLERASTYHFLALLFLPPTIEVLDELRVLAGALPGDLRADGEALAAGAGPEVELEYHALLGGSGRCRDCESDHEINALGGKGPLLADVAAFYRAFRFAAELRLAPDHIAVELDFLGFLAMKTACARHAGLTDEREICEAAAASFQRDHLARWTPQFLAQLESTAGDGFHGRAARLAARALR